ncbi:hypothetical protein CNX65_26830 [Actinosynnema pretiosum]|uniref:Uncharacterized protein n=1 Tax=Actinosynnema pretiosum TaxID=42197 RepID=A0A290ZBU6_9PSEU|nr:hypothetical protein CNX65_26830 [Actinosynnema pretiosum]
MLRGEWRGLPPIQRALPEHPLVNPVSSFTGGLTSWRSPAFLAPLGHFVAESEPSGVIGEPPREGVVFSRPWGIPAGVGSAASGTVGTSPATEGLAGDGFTGGGFAESAAATGGTATRAATAAGGTAVQRSVTPEPPPLSPEPVSAEPEPVVRTLGVDRPVPIDVETPASPRTTDPVEPVAQALPLAPQTPNATPEPAVQRVAEAPPAPVSRQFTAPPRAVRSGLGEPLAQRPAETPVMPGFPEAGSAPSEESVSGQPSNGLPVGDSPISDGPTSGGITSVEPTSGGTTGDGPISAGLVGDEPLTGDVVRRAVAPDAVSRVPATVSRSVELPVVPAPAAPTTTVGKSTARALGLGRPRTIQTSTTPARPSAPTAPGAPSTSSAPTTPQQVVQPAVQRLAGGERPVSLTEIVQRSLAADQPAARAVELPAGLPAELPVAPSTPSVPSGTSAPVQRFEQAPVLSLAPGLPQRFVQRQAESTVSGPQPTWSVQGDLAAPSAPAPGPRIPTGIAGLTSMSAIGSTSAPAAGLTSAAGAGGTSAAGAGHMAALGGGIGSVGPSGWSLDPQIAQSLGVSLGEDQHQPGLAVQGYTAPQQGSPAQQALSAQEAFPVQQGFAARPGIGAPQRLPVQTGLPVQSGPAVQLSPAAQSASPSQPAFSAQPGFPAQPEFPPPPGPVAQSVLPAPPNAPAPQPLPLAPAFPAPPPGSAAHPHFAVQRELYDPPPGEPPVPPQAAPPPTPNAPPPGHPEAPTDPSAASAPMTASASTTSAPPATPTPEPEELLKKLYDPLLRRLKAELWLDRERRGSLTDRPR